MERIVNNKRKINELNVDVVALKKAYTEAMQTSRQNNMQQQIIETIDISCDWVIFTLLYSEWSILLWTFYFLVRICEYYFEISDICLNKERNV